MEQVCCILKTTGLFQEIVQEFTEGLFVHRLPVHKAAVTYDIYGRKSCKIISKDIRRLGTAAVADIDPRKLLLLHNPGPESLVGIHRHQVDLESTLVIVILDTLEDIKVEHLLGCICRAPETHHHNL